MARSVRLDRAILVIAVWAVLISQVLIYPGLEDIVTALGGSDGIRDGMLFLVAEFAAFVAFATVWGLISDISGRRVPWIVIGSLGGAACYLLLPHVPSLGGGFEAVLAVRVVGGAFTIGAFSLSLTMLMDLTGGHGRNMGAAGIAIGLGAAIGSVTGGQLATMDPMAPLYGAAITLLGVAALATTVRDRAPESRLRLGGVLSGIRTRPTLGIPYAFGFIDRLTAGFFSLVGVFYFRDVFGVDAAVAGFTLAMFFLPFALFQYPFGALSDRIGRFYPVVGGSILYGLTIVAVGLAPIYGLAAVAMVAVGISGAFMAPATMALVTDIAEIDERGLAMGGFNVFGSLGFLAGFLIGGLTVEFANYITAFLLVGGLEILIALVLVTPLSRLTGVDRQGTIEMGHT